MSELASGPAIQSGRANGLLEFADFMVQKGYGTSAAWSPRKSAARRILEVVEGSEDFDDVDVRNLDLNDYLGRFETKALGSMKAESIASYKSRFTSAVVDYKVFLDTGQPPRTATRRGQVREDGAGSAGTSRRPKQAARKQERHGNATVGAEEPVTPSTGERLIDYPFPLRSGGIALLRLPVHLEKTDAERLGAFIRTLVLEPQLGLPAGSSDSGDK